MALVPAGIDLGWLKHTKEKVMANTNVEQDVGYIGARLREKSTYAGLAAMLGFGIALTKGHIDPTALAGALESLGIGIGALIAIFVPENGSKA